MSFFQLTIAITAAIFLVLGVTRVVTGRTELLPEDSSGRSRLAHVAIFAIWFVVLANISAGEPLIVGIGAGLLVWLVLKIITTSLIAFVGAEHPNLRLGILQFAGKDPSGFEPRVRRVHPLAGPFVEAVATLDEANGRFPRGSGFMASVERPTFEADWAALDKAVRGLDRLVAQSEIPAHPDVARRLSDALGRLQTLREGATA